MSTRKAPGKPVRAARHSKVGRRLIQAMEQVEAHIKGEISLPTRYIQVPDRVDVKRIREQLGLSQSEFARRYGFSTRSLQEWEQGRRQPESAVRAYFLVIEGNPDAVEAALSGRRRMLQ